MRDYLKRIAEIIWRNLFPFGDDERHICREMNTNGTNGTPAVDADEPFVCIQATLQGEGAEEEEEEEEEEEVSCYPEDVHRAGSACCQSPEGNGREPFVLHDNALYGGPDVSDGSAGSIDDTDARKCDDILASDREEDHPHLVIDTKATPKTGPEPIGEVPMTSGPSQMSTSEVEVKANDEKREKKKKKRNKKKRNK